MNKYIIVLRRKEDISKLDNYELFNIEIHFNIIIFAHMAEETFYKIENKDIVKSIEKDRTDSHDSENISDVRYKSSKTTYTFDMMEISKFHDEGLTGKGFKIAILDTGIQKHVNLKVAGGINVYDSNKPWDNSLTNTHGTMVAGVLNAQGVNGDILGIVPDAEIYAVRIDNGNGSINTTTWSSQIAGMSWAVENKMDAVNCSFSSRIDSEARKTAFRMAYDSGIAIFCSAGNEQPESDNKTNTARYPAKYPFTISSANIDSNKKRYPTSCIGQGINFSNGGTSVRLTDAPSGLSTVSSDYSNGTGTSMSSPATLGIYILYKQKYGESRDKIFERMAVNAEHLGDAFWYGAGLPKYPTHNYKNIQIRG